MMTGTSIEQRNKEVLNQMHQAIKRDGLTAQVEFFAEQSHNHGFPTSRADIWAVLDDIENTFPDVNFEPHQIVAEGDLVMVRYTMSGTHMGVQKLPFVHGGFLAGVAPTGKRIKVKHIHIFRFKDSQVIEHDAVQDNLEMARQLGVRVETGKENE
jgi:predicted ester cyclase